MVTEALIKIISKGVWLKLKTRNSLATSRGFTLLEVLVALVITLIALNVLFGGVASSLRIAHDTRLWDRAVSSAQSHLAAISNPAAVVGEIQSGEADGFRWRTRVALIGAAPAPNPARGGAWARGTGLYGVSVTISWHEGGTEQQFRLDSARLGPVAGYGP
jgi:general secretion pathway protein I